MGRVHIRRRIVYACGGAVDKYVPVDPDMGIIGEDGDFVI